MSAEFASRHPSAVMDPRGDRSYLQGMVQEHRINPRHRTLKGGKITYANDTCVIDCVIRNLSLTGACLVVPMTIGIPRSFTLYVHGGAHHPTGVVWRKGDRVGVRFLDVTDMPPAGHLPRAARRFKPRRSIHRATTA
jgi:hypothetical protein